jgi:hypothetical protein
MGRTAVLEIGAGGVTCTTGRLDWVEPVGGTVDDEVTIVELTVSAVCVGYGELLVVDEASFWVGEAEAAGLEDDALALARVLVLREGMGVRTGPSTNTGRSDSGGTATTRSVAGGGLVVVVCGGYIFAGGTNGCDLVRVGPFQTS